MSYPPPSPEDYPPNHPANPNYVALSGPVVEEFPKSLPRAQWKDVESPLLYPAAPVTLIDAVRLYQAGLWTKRPLRGFNWWFGDAFIMIVLYFVFGIAAFIAVGGAAEPTGWAVIAIQAAPWIALVGWPAVLTYWRGNGIFIDLGLRWRWSDIGWGLLYGFAALVVAIIIGAITTMIQGEFSSAAGDVGESLAQNPAVLIAFVICVVIGAPIAEEIAFRGMIFTSLAKFKMWPILTVIMSAAIFALFHGEPVRFPLLFGIGLVLGLARWHTGSVTTAIVAHMVNNAVGGIGLLMLLGQ